MIAGKKIFGTDGIRDTANQGYLTPEFLLKLGRVLGTFLRKNPASFHSKQLPRITGFHNIPSNRSRRLNPIVIIGRDPRASGQMIENAVSAGLLAAGIDVINAGMISTPGLAYLTRRERYALGIMISASHNPAEDNGVKLLSPEGLKIPDALELKIEKELLDPDRPSTSPTGNGSALLTVLSLPKYGIGIAYNQPQKADIYIKEIIKHVLGQKISFKGFKIVLDCANGAVSAIAPEVFSRLGAKVIALKHQPDGQNINQYCGSLYPEVTARAVRRYKADIGFSFDGDGDRVICVDEKGQIRDGDFVMAIAGRFLKKHRSLPGNSVVTTVMSNIGLFRSFKEAGINPVITPVGDRYVIEKMLKGNFPLGGEQSGHIIFLNQSTTGDGLITALEMLKIMKAEKKYFSALAGCMRKFPQVLVNVKVKTKRPFDQIKPIRQKAAEIEKMLGAGGRLLLRYSGTEPLARIMLEGEHKKQITSLAGELARVIKKYLG